MPSGKPHVLVVVNRSMAREGGVSAAQELRLLHAGQLLRVLRPGTDVDRIGAGDLVFLPRKSPSLEARMDALKTMGVRTRLLTTDKLAKMLRGVPSARTIAKDVADRWPPSQSL